MALLGSTPCGSALSLAWVPPNVASLGFLPNHAWGEYKLCHDGKQLKLTKTLSETALPGKSVASNLAIPQSIKNNKLSQDYILSSNHQLQSLYNLTRSLTNRKSPLQGLLSICPVPLEHRQLQEIIEIEIRPQEMPTRMSWG